jgi:hypothetical protein
MAGENDKRTIMKGAFECLVCKAGLLPTRVEPRKNFFRPLMVKALFCFTK